MRRGLLFLMLPLFLLVFGACEGPEGPPGRDGYDELYRVVRDFTIEPGMWKYVDDEGGFDPHYVCEIPWSDLDYDIFEYGTIQGYIYLNPNRKNDGYLPLGDVYPVDQGADYLSTIVFFSYICYPGGIIFTARYSDFNDVEEEYWHPGRQIFHMVLTD